MVVVVHVEPLAAFVVEVLAAEVRIVAELAAVVAAEPFQYSQYSH